MTQEQLYQQQQAQKQLGDRGEDFVLRYERQRLAAHPQVSSVRIIGRADVGMGYDILSFHGITSQHHDRYIEVKTYSGTPHFFLSPGEQAAAEKYTTDYYLYLVDATKVSTPGYQPLVIQNPIHSLFNDANNDSSTHWQEKVRSREFTFVDENRENLSADIDTSTVLVGCYTTNEHLNWILRNHAYNVRSSFINGAVNKDAVTTGVRYLLLYWVREPRTYRVYEVDGVATVSRDYMINKAYPSPHAKEYILYHLKRQVKMPLIDSIQIVRIYNDKLHRTSGTPIYLSGAELKKFMATEVHQQGVAPRRTYTNEHKPWTADHKARLAALYAAGTDVAALAHLFHRPADEIEMQLRNQYLI